MSIFAVNLTKIQTAVRHPAALKILLAMKDFQGK
jgi:hypothetical protein